MCTEELLKQGTNLSLANSVYKSTRNVYPYALTRFPSAHTHAHTCVCACMQTQASRTWANVLCSPNGHGLSALCKAPCEAVRSALAKTSHGKARRVRAHVHSYAPRRGASAPPAPRTAQDGDVCFRVPAPGGALTGNPRIWTSPLPGTVCGPAHSHIPTFRCFRPLAWKDQFKGQWIGIHRQLLSCTSRQGHYLAGI